jgi:hypothetical protein
MEISDIKRQVLETIGRARRQAAERRGRADEAGRAYETFLHEKAVPVLKQVANVLRAEGFTFTVSTPAGSVRLTSDRTAEDFVELTLDTTADPPLVTGHASRAWGRRVIETDRALGAPDALTEEQVLSFVLKALEPLVER